MYELRVISGFHRGATLLLDERSHSIGANDGADVVLIDASIAEHHATLHRTASGWSLEATGGSIYTPKAHKSQKIINLVPSSFVLVGDVWLSIVEQDSPWTEPPKEMIDAAKAKINSNGVDDFQVGKLGDRNTLAQEQQELNSSPNCTKQRKGLKFVVAPLAIVAVLSAAAAYAMTVKSSSHQQTQGNATEISAKNISASSLPQEQLRNIFRKRLTEADLIKEFDLNLKDNSWKMSASLDDAETKQFEKILLGFMQDYKVTFPVNADITGAEMMLPFKIRSVVSGANPRIVTEEGRRIAVGEEYRGVRLVAINPKSLVFSGKRKIEMDW